jgi:molybdopterin-containing oxidoreductase family membrane subunit
MLWLGFIGLFLIWGLISAGLVLYKGLGTTELDNYFGFGLWITFDLAIIALGAGAFFSGALKYLLGISQLKNIVNLAVIVGFLCYSGAMIVLGLDVGQPLRAWFGFWHPNVHSMLTEVMFCITCYLMVLAIEYIPIILEQRQLNRIPFLHYMAHNLHIAMPLFAGIGAFLSTFHQGSLGGMYGVLFARPYIFREGFFIWPWTFFLFVLSAIGSGPMFTVLCAKLCELLSGKKLVDYRVKTLMAKIAGSMLALYVFFKILDTVGWIQGVLVAAGIRYESNFYGFMYGEWLLWAEIGTAIAACIMLLSKNLRNQPFFLYLGGILACTSISINRYVFTVQALAMPVLPFDEWVTYLPNWVEWGATFLVIAYGFLVVSLSYRYLPVFPQEVKLNRKA